MVPTVIKLLQSKATLFDSLGLIKSVKEYVTTQTDLCNYKHQ